MLCYQQSQHQAILEEYFELIGRFYEQNIDSYTVYVMQEIRRQYITESMDHLQDWRWAFHLRQIKDFMQSKWVNSIINGYDQVLFDSPQEECMVK